VVEVPEPTVTYVWCFSHGHIHGFRPSTEHPDGQWCTANWVPLAGDAKADALAEKQTRFGDARFDHQLPRNQQLEVVRACAARRAKG
jgi:hypothetical protein